MARRSGSAPFSRRYAISTRGGGPRAVIYEHAPNASFTISRRNRRDRAFRDSGPDDVGVQRQERVNSRTGTTSTSFHMASVRTLANITKTYGFMDCAPKRGIYGYTRTKPSNPMTPDMHVPVLISLRDPTENAITIKTAVAYCKPSSSQLSTSSIAPSLSCPRGAGSLSCTCTTLLPCTLRTPSFQLS